MKDELGDRMKSYYEDRTRTYLPRRSNVILRIDGKAFHTYTKGLARPFDQLLIDDMDATAKFLCENIQGAKLAYVQSDEISILITDYDKKTTDAWFDYNVQKMCSISASLATSQFNKLRAVRFLESNMHTTFLQKFKVAHFDSRAFTSPSEDEVINYFIWRQQDASRNSIQAVGQSLYSHKELNNKTVDDMQELIFQKGQNWNDYPIGQKRGRVIVKRPKLVEITKLAAEKSKDKSQFIVKNDAVFIERNAWTVEEPPIFTSEKNYIRKEFGSWIVYSGGVLTGNNEIEVG